MCSPKLGKRKITGTVTSTEIRDAKTTGRWLKYETRKRKIFLVRRRWNSWLKSLKEGAAVIRVCGSVLHPASGPLILGEKYYTHGRTKEKSKPKGETV